MEEGGDDPGQKIIKIGPDINLAEVGDRKQRRQHEENHQQDRLLLPILPEMERRQQDQRKEKIECQFCRDAPVDMRFLQKQKMLKKQRGRHWKIKSGPTEVKNP